MLRAFRDSSFIRLFILMAVGLIVLALAGGKMAWRPVLAADLAGTYGRAPIPFVHVGHLPESVVLAGDGTLRLLSGSGAVLFQGTWRLDGKERSVRVDDPRWDRRMRVRGSLLGPRLCMRISDLPLETDHPEHDEEVDLLRIGVEGGPFANGTSY